MVSKREQAPFAPAVRVPADAQSPQCHDTRLRHLVGVLLILPELERSGDLAEHIAQRAVTNIGAEMSPLSRGIVQRMSEVALEMWRDAADAYAIGPRASALTEDDVEMTSSMIG